MDKFIGLGKWQQESFMESGGFMLILYDNDTQVMKGETVRFDVDGREVKGIVMIMQKDGAQRRICAVVDESRIVSDTQPPASSEVAEETFSAPYEIVTPAAATEAVAPLEPVTEPSSILEELPLVEQVEAAPEPARPMTIADFMGSPEYDNARVLLEHLRLSLVILESLPAKEGQVRLELDQGGFKANSRSKATHGTWSHRRLATANDVVAHTLTYSPKPSEAQVMEIVWGKIDPLKGRNK